MILTPPPYTPCQSIAVQCPDCHQIRWLQWDSRYLRQPPERCHACAARHAEITISPRRRRFYGLQRRRRRIRACMRRLGRPWKSSVIQAYQTLGLSMEQTGELLGVSKQTIHNDLVRWGVRSRRPRGGANHRYGRCKNPERAVMMQIPLP